MNKSILLGVLLGTATGSVTTAALKDAAAKAKEEHYDPRGKRPPAD